MDIPIDPIIKASLEDNSKSDESFNSQSNTYNVSSGGAVI
jgi:hypothetical protein